MGDQAVLGYWKIRGRAGQIRLALSYCGENYRDELYDDWPKSIADAMKIHAEKKGMRWYQEKFTSGMHFPNLPYLYIDGYKLSQAMAILAYLGRKHGLVGKTENERQALDQLKEAMGDFFQGLVRIIYAVPKEGFEEAAEQYKSKDRLEAFEQLAEFLGNNKFAVGDHVTYIDFQLFEFLDWQREFDSDCFDAYPTLKAYVERFAALPKIAEALGADNWIQRPIFAPFSNWQ